MFQLQTLVATVSDMRILSFSLTTVAINLIVQHIQDILNGGLNKRPNGWINGYGFMKQQQPGVESSSRPH